MKCIGVSDLHGDLIDIPECDLLLIAGDITPANASPRNKNIDNHLNWLETKFGPWLEGVPAKHVVGVAGNHDFVFQDALPEIPEMRWHYLENSYVEIEGVKIWGTPWTPWFHNWAFNAPQIQPDGDEFMARVCAGAPNDTDVFLTHGPPKNILDKCDFGGDRAGCPEIMKRIAEVRPRAHVFGHIHERHGLARVDKTTFYNVSINNLDYEPVNKPTEFYLY